MVPYQHPYQRRFAILRIMCFSLWVVISLPGLPAAIKCLLQHSFHPFIVAEAVAVV